MTDKIKDIVVIFVFGFITLGMLFVNIIKEDNQISISERRKLATFPIFTSKEIFNGNFAKKFDQYAMDQFVKRESFRKLKTNIELNLFKKQDVNNIYKYNDFLVEQLYPLNEKSVENITKKMNEIKTKYLDGTNKIYYTIIPDKNYYINKSNLKLDYNKIKQIMNSNLNDMQYIDIFDCLDLNCYYYTDSHWKQENILKVAEKLAQNMNFNIAKEFEKQEVSKFKGVYSGQLPVNTKEDTINILTNNTIKNCEVYNYEKNETTSIYNLSKLNEYDKYDVYLSGATALLEIKNSNGRKDKELIVFRDSYASSLIPLMVEEYSKITLIDTRYVSPKILKDLVNFEGKDILFLYSTLVINNSTALK